LVAKTGTKTAAFGLPLLQLIDTSSPSIQACFGSYRVRAADFRNLEDFAKYLPEVSIAATCGGIPIKPQIERLAAPTHMW
jgi:ATP-dependent RNA helicase DeaD